MGPNNKPLQQDYSEVRNAIEDKLKNSKQLQDVQDVIYGERRRIGSLRSPAIWIVPEPYQPELKGGHTADHDFSFNFVALIKQMYPEEGLKEAERLSHTIYDVLMEDRTLGGHVFDVRPTQVDPAYEAGRNTQLCFAAVQFSFRTKRRE